MLVKRIRLIIALCWISILGICGMLAYLLTHSEQEFACGTCRATDSPIPHDSVFYDGKALFQANCASCHNPFKDATGPALMGISQYRTADWVCKFITQSQFKPTDERHKQLRRVYQASCMKFPTLTCAEIEAMFVYVEYSTGGIP